MVVVRSVMFLAVLLSVLAPNSSLAQCSPLSTTTSPADLRLGWKPSPSPTAAGYFLCWGVASGQCTNRIDVGSVTNTTVSGLQADFTYYFTIVAYSAYGDEAPPSNEVSFGLPSSPTIPQGPKLEMSLSTPSGGKQNVRLTFSATVGHSYEVEATSDFKSWATIWTTTPLSSRSITFIEPRRSSGSRFYRLKEQTINQALPRGQKLEMSLTTPNGGEPNVQLTFSGSVGYSYEVQATSDFKSWATIWTTTPDSNSAVTFSEPRRPNGARFYRLLERVN